MLLPMANVTVLIIAQSQGMRLLGFSLMQTCQARISLIDVATGSDFMFRDFQSVEERIAGVRSATSGICISRIIKSDQ